MSNQTARFKHRDPTLWRITKRLADRFVEMTGAVDQEYLKEVGINYSTFSTYLTGRTAMPGWVQARLLEYVSWDWAWGLATNERVVLAESILRDRATTQTARLRVMALYFGVLRAAHDFSGHVRLVRDLRRRFPADSYPLERAAVAHDECLIRDAQRGEPSGDPESAAQVIQRWQGAFQSLLTAEVAGYSDPDVRVAILRDRATAIASLVPVGDLPSEELYAHLIQARDDLIACEHLIPNRTAMSFHLHALVHVEAVLRDFSSAHDSLKKLQILCSSEPRAIEDRSGLWLRYDLALAFLTERTEGRESARQHLSRARKRLRHIGCATWEADILRQLQ